jgi:hypothetical protein
MHLSQEIFCYYTNDTDQYQIIRISNIPCWFFERVVFPGKSVTFSTFPNSLLEVHTGVFSSSILSDIIPCDRLLLKPDRKVPISVAHPSPNGKPSLEPWSNRQGRGGERDLA